MNSPESIQRAEVPSGDERDLVLAYQRGEGQVYEVIHQRFETRVASVCRRMLGSKEDAEEATQETFLRVHQALPRFNGRYQLSAWITRIATNVCLDMLRSRARRPVDAVADELLLLEPLDDPTTDPEVVTLRAAEGRRVRRVLAQLPPMHRAAIVLRDFEGFSYAEVATALQISECQVKALIHRARQRFKRSWLAGASALLPWRIIQRVRGLETLSRDGAANMASSTAPTVVSCSSVWHNCGQYVSDHVVQAVASVVVGATLASSGAGVVAPRETVASTPDAPRVSTASGLGSSDPEPTKPASRGATGDTHASVATTEEPAPAPQPAPSSSPAEDGSTKQEPESTEVVPPDPTPAPSPTSPPKPPSTKIEDGGTSALSVGWVTGGEAPPAATADRHAVSFSCANQTLTQDLVVNAGYADGSIPMRARLSVSPGTGAELDFELLIGSYWRRYSSWGARPDVQWTAGPTTRLEISGSYGPLAGYDTTGGPGAGDFDIAMSLDCDAATVATASLSFVSS